MEAADPVRALAVVLLLAAPAGADMIDSDSLPPYEICALCHSLDGNSVMSKFPKLAGQRRDYIAKQVRDFRAGHRTNDGGQMASIVLELAEDDIPVVADWFSRQPPPAPQGESDPRGAELYKKLACASCHERGPHDGLTPPHIAAQHSRYIEKQLREFRDGWRENDPDGVMRTAAAGLSDDDISALAAYLAAQPRK